MCARVPLSWQLLCEEQLGSGDGLPRTREFRTSKLTLTTRSGQGRGNGSLVHLRAALLLRGPRRAEEPDTIYYCEGKNALEDMALCRHLQISFKFGGK